MDGICSRLPDVSPAIALGREVKFIGTSGMEGENVYRMDVSDLAEGIYSVSIIVDGQPPVSSKIMIQR